MALVATATRPPRADYLSGDPAEPGSIAGGHLHLEPDGLRFTGPDGDELRIGLDSLLAITISGRSPQNGGRRHRRGARHGIHGTMRVAGLAHGEPTEWRFAIDRDAAAGLQKGLNRQLAMRGAPPLPHIEELVGFQAREPLSPHEPLAPLFPAEEDFAEERVEADQPAITPYDRVAAELGHRLDAADRKPKRRRILPWAALGVVLVLAEVAVPLLIIRGV